MTAKDVAINDGKTAITTSDTVEAETILNKKKNGGKEKDEMAKIVLRRLPSGMSKDELFAQLQPLQPEPCAFWFCPSDMEMRPHAFSRAYLVFQEEKDAVQFAERFNGYVFVDKLG
uniref:Smg4_UPF3 domain-containing protein n=1 Tax=Meloidogyne hapla TaxID=6305 RepID=A0A1I8B922_MELHA